MKVIVPDVSSVGGRRFAIVSENPLIPVLVPTGLNGLLAKTQLLAPAPLTEETTPAMRRWDDRKGLAKLVLQISHRCNLTCPYCISDAGRWGTGQSGLMSPDVARRAIRFFAEQFKAINVIYLFGGEPVLNPNVIRTVCDETEKLVSEKVLERMPDIGFTTNGTILNKPLVELLRDKPYLKVSVSVDGPPDIHDRFRRDVKGRPTYDIIVEN